MKDWTVEQAEKFAKICRKHGLNCRVIRCKNYDSYLRIYGDKTDENFVAQVSKAKKEAVDVGWEGFYDVVKNKNI